MGVVSEVWAKFADWVWACVRIFIFIEFRLVVSWVSKLFTRFGFANVGLA